MSRLGTAQNPVRAAIVGSGPSGFYAAEALLRSEPVVLVDMFERLPSPFGLVRSGVAPDHPKLKQPIRVYQQIAASPQFRFLGNVTVGRDITVPELKGCYHVVVYACGAETDRKLGIPGAHLVGSHAATEFVGWYNGHPDYRHLQFDLTPERAAVVGIGNVAIDVARILCRTVDELRTTDIADYALEALSKSHVKEVYLLGRRGPAQAAFTPPEIKEVGEMADADVVVLPEEAQLDPLSQAAVASASDRSVLKNVEILQGYAVRKPTGKSRRLTVRFLVSPVELIGDAAGRVVKMRLVKNRLVASETGSLSAKATDQLEELPVGLVFRSVGYRGVPLPDVPFHEKWGVILNEKGRVIDPESKQPFVGQYTAGWIKRGPSGVIGTNKPDAVETVNCMLEDLAQDKLLQPSQPQSRCVEDLVRARQPQFFTFADWLKLDEMEVARGQAQGRPRVKFTSVEEMLAALGR